MNKRHEQTLKWLLNILEDIQFKLYLDVISYPPDGQKIKNTNNVVYWRGCG